MVKHTKFSIGDTVEVVQVIDDMNSYPLLIGDRGEILEISWEDYSALWSIKVAWDKKYHGFFRNNTWWVDPKAIQIVTDTSRSPYYKIERKIKEIKTRRESLGYKW